MSEFITALSRPENAPIIVAMCLSIFIVGFVLLHLSNKSKKRKNERAQIISQMRKLEMDAEWDVEALQEIDSFRIKRANEADRPSVFSARSKSDHGATDNSFKSKSPVESTQNQSAVILATATSDDSSYVSTNNYGSSSDNSSSYSSSCSSDSGGSSGGGGCD